ncbi:MAG TPA: hypothetical protein VMU59_15250 [Caulobacteraceae bacterium]|nr:hypothetical protein [Caulobacteraceae bacterium]
MSIGVQSTNAALLALQTLGQLTDPTSTDPTTTGAASSASGPASATTPTVIADPALQSLSANGLDAASASLDRASSITDAALSAGASISGLLDQMKALVGGVQDGSVSGQAASGDYSALLSQISAAVSGAGFEGVNLLDGSSAPAVTVGSGTSGQVTLTATNLSLGSGVITLGSATSLSASTVSDLLGDIDASMANLNQALAPIGDQSSQIAAHASFVARLSTVLSASGGASASAPTSADGARLMALQVQQQLSATGASIASAAPSVILSLFQ